MGTDLEIYIRMFNLLKRIYPALRNYPKSEKHALAQDTKNCFYEYLTYVSRANNVKSKRLVYAQEAEAYLQKIKLNKYSIAGKDTQSMVIVITLFKVY